MNKQRGFTLGELMIATTVGLLLSIVVLTVFLNGTQTYSVQNSFGRLQENARFALSTMQRDIRMAGYRGCLGGRNDTLITVAINSTLAAPIAYQSNLAVGLQGYEAGAGWTPALDASIAGATPAPASGTDVITVRSAVSPGIPVTSSMASASTDPVIVASTASLTSGGTALIADCVASTVFQVTDLTGDPGINHAATGANASNNLGRAFGTDALVFPVSTITYYVGKSSNAPTGTETSLWQQTNGNSVEIAEGIENIQILYGEDLNGDLVPDRYVTASNVLNWNNVVAVNLSILVHTIEDHVAVTPQQYTYNGVSNIIPPDLRVRRAFETTITLRNRTY